MTRSDVPTVRSMAQSINDCRMLGFKDSVIDDVMYGNAKRVLSLAS